MQLVILVGQIEGNLLKSGRFRLDNIFIVTPLLLRFGHPETLSGSKLVSKQFACPGFSGPATKLDCHPLINAMVTLGLRV